MHKYSYNSFNKDYQARKDNFEEYVNQLKDETIKAADGSSIAYHDWLLEWQNFSTDRFMYLFMKLYIASKNNEDPGADIKRWFIDILIKGREEKKEDGKKISREGKLVRINNKEDKADFDVSDLVRFLYEFYVPEGDDDFPGLTKMFGPESCALIIKNIKDALLGFKYWYDEKSDDSMWFWTENHFILFSVNEYLVGQLFEKDTFKNRKMNGEQLTGEQRMKEAAVRINKWLKLRFYTGFSEWLSNVYYAEDIRALLNLIDFCEDAAIKENAKSVMDLLVADMALNSLHGIFGSTHGRCYARHKLFPTGSTMAAVMLMLFGMGFVNKFDVDTASALLYMSNYDIDPVLYGMATDTAKPVVNRQRMGIKISDLHDLSVLKGLHEPEFSEHINAIIKKLNDTWGIDLNNPEDVPYVLTFDALTDPRTVDSVVKFINKYKIILNRKDLSHCGGLVNYLVNQHEDKLVLAAKNYYRELTFMVREEVNIYTYRTKNYMLSSAQDYRPGYGGHQQHIWQATLYPEQKHDEPGDSVCGVCFTTHPCFDRGVLNDKPINLENDKSTPGYWAGSGMLPRVAQMENVCIVCYDIKDSDQNEFRKLFKELPYTHAYLNFLAFDSIAGDLNAVGLRDKHWLFGKKGNAYLALYSQYPYEPHLYKSQDGSVVGLELIADNKSHNIWICELGEGESDDDFKTFCSRLREPDRVKISQESKDKNAWVTYTSLSPAVGTLIFGFDRDFNQNGTTVDLHNYKRYENPYAKIDYPANFDGKTMKFKTRDGQELPLAFKS